jgi:histidyl-tRNA synthetase
MQNGIQTPKGTRDFYPADMRLQNHVFDGWRRVCRAFGYEEYEGPTFEHLELYVGKSGEEIVGQLYNFKDKGDRELALRPELTPTLARMVNAKGPALRKPLKWFSIPRLFRYERAQRGRLREFFQLNMDIVGCDTVAAEVDLIAAVIEMLRGYGLGHGDFAVRISSRRLLSEFLSTLGIEEARKAPVYSALDKRAKIGEEAFRKLLADEGLSQDQADRLETFFQTKNIADLPMDTVKVDTRFDAPKSGDIVLLCSDGLAGPVTDEDIFRIIQTSPDITSAAAQLISRANENGGPDNVTAVLARWV